MIYKLLFLGKTNVLSDLSYERTACYSFVVALKENI